MQRLSVMVLVLLAVSACQSTVTSQQTNAGGNTKVYGSLGVSSEVNSGHQSIGVSGSL